MAVSSAKCNKFDRVQLNLETAVDRFMAVKKRMHKHGDGPLHLFTWWVRSLRARQAPPWDARAVLLLLAGISQPRRRAWPGQPMAAHSGAFDCGF